MVMNSKYCSKVSEKLKEVSHGSDIMEITGDLDKSSIRRRSRQNQIVKLRHEWEMRK